VPSAQDFSAALVHERSFPDFDSPALAKSRRKTATPKKPPLSGAALVAALANLTDEQKKSIAALVKKAKT